jgi:predicted RecB family nuclease
LGENLNEEPQRQPSSENFSDLAQPEALDLTGSGWADLPGIRSSVRRPFGKPAANASTCSPGAHLYHYAPYEKTALRRLASMHATLETAVDELLRTNRMVDLYRVVRESVRVGEPGYSIKNLERFGAIRP